MMMIHVQDLHLVAGKELYNCRSSGTMGAIIVPFQVVLTGRKNQLPKPKKSLQNLIITKHAFCLPSSLPNFQEKELRNIIQKVFYDIHDIFHKPSLPDSKNVQS